MTANTDAVRGFFERQYAGDLPGAFAAFAQPDFYWVVSTRDNPELAAVMPWGGRRYEGEVGHLDFAGQLFGEYEVLAFDAEDYTDAGDRVFVQGHFRFKHRVTGKIADSDWLARFDMRDGRIAGGQFFENTYAVVAGRVSSEILSAI